MSKETFTIICGYCGQVRTLVHWRVRTDKEPLISIGSDRETTDVEIHCFNCKNEITL